MKRIMTKTLAFLLVVGGLVTVLWPVPSWRMYDALWQPLAMTQAESYCSGYVLGQNDFNNILDPEGVSACMAESKLDNSEPAIGSSIRLACTGLSIWFPEYVVADCERDVEAYQVWFLKDGGYTWEWNESNPRPQIAQYNISQAPSRDSRNEGERDSSDREGLGE